MYFPSIYAKITSLFLHSKTRAKFKNDMNIMQKKKLRVQTQRSVFATRVHDLVQVSNTILIFAIHILLSFICYQIDTPSQQEQELYREYLLIKNNKNR